jgi:hypothetical protein
MKYMTIKKNAYCSLVLEFFCESKFSCKRSNIQKIQKSTPPEIGRCLGLILYLGCQFQANKS